MATLENKLSIRLPRVVLNKELSQRIVAENSFSSSGKYLRTLLQKIVMATLEKNHNKIRPRNMVLDKVLLQIIVAAPAENQ